mmetsp:Transcript_26568/g.70882  ORF Transcript_26568/g.70882 Transcript_26568/m.70882 type:complete len:244 (+) Transcript_26568:330-1061(+)
MTHGNSPERPKHCLHAHRHSSPHFLQVRFARPAALTALCAPWRRFGADKVLRRRRELHQHHGRGSRREPVVRRKTLRSGEVSGSGGARTPRRRIQLGAAAAACRRAHGAPAAAAPTPCAGAPREQRLAPGTAGACSGRGALSGWTAAGASHPITSGARDRCGSACGRVRCWQCRCDRCAPVLRAPVRACVDERAGGRVEAVAALETRMAGTSGSGLCGMQVWAHDSAVTHVCGGCRTAPDSRG